MTPCKANIIVEPIAKQIPSHQISQASCIEALTSYPNQAKFISKGSQDNPSANDWCCDMSNQQLNKQTGFSEEVKSKLLKAQNNQNREFQQLVRQQQQIGMALTLRQPTM